MSAATWIIALIVLVLLIGGGVVLYRSTEPRQDASGEFLEYGESQEPGPFIQERSEEQPAIRLQEDATPSTAPDVSNPSPRTTSSPAGSQATVSMTDTGFSPATVTVASGTTVTFVNNGQGSHWPASDLHPTHTLLSGFDALRGLTTGERYSFTFTKKGTWKFHDHLQPQFTGSVTVE